MKEITAAIKAVLVSSLAILIGVLLSWGAAAFIPSYLTTGYLDARTLSFIFGVSLPATLMLATSVEINYRSQFSSPMRFPGFWLPYPVMVLVVLIIFAHFGYIYHYAPTLLAQILFPIWNTVAGLFLRPPELRSNKALTSLQNLRAVNDGIHVAFFHICLVFFYLFSAVPTVWYYQVPLGLGLSLIGSAAGALVERLPYVGYTALFTTFGIDSLCALFQSVVLPDLEGWLSFSVMLCAEWAMGLLWIMAPDIRAALRDRCGSARVAAEAPDSAARENMYVAPRADTPSDAEASKTALESTASLVPVSFPLLTSGDAAADERLSLMAPAARRMAELAVLSNVKCSTISSEVQQILRERAVEHQICEMGLLCLAEISSPLIYMLVVTLCRYGTNALSLPVFWMSSDQYFQSLVFASVSAAVSIATSIAFAVIYRCRRGDVPVFAVLWEFVRENYHSIGVQVMLNNMLLTVFFVVQFGWYYPLFGASRAS